MDFYKLLMDRYLEAGLSRQQAENLARYNSDTSYNKPPLDEYNSALERRVKQFHSAGDKSASDSFMRSFQDTKPKMTTGEFFDKGSDYAKDPGAGKVPDKYIDAVKKQRLNTMSKDTRKIEIWNDYANNLEKNNLIEAKSAGKYGFDPKPEKVPSFDQWKTREDMLLAARENKPTRYRSGAISSEFNKLNQGQPTSEIIPESRGSGVIGNGAKVVGGIALPIAVHYLNEKTYGEFNPLDIKSAGEGEDEKMQEVNALNKKRYLESLGRGPSSETLATPLTEEDLNKQLLLKSLYEQAQKEQAPGYAERLMELQTLGNPERGFLGTDGTWHKPFQTTPSVNETELNAINKASIASRGVTFDKLSQQDKLKMLMSLQQINPPIITD